MVLRTRRLSALALVPPGPQERSVQLLASEIFTSTGEPRSLLLPGFVLLAIGERPGDGVDGPRLGRLWEGISGSFKSDRLFLESGGLYLGLEGPLAALSERAWTCVIGEAATPLLPGRGFYLGPHRPESGERIIEGHRSLATTGLSFHAASLSLLELDLDLPDLHSLAWIETARAWRPRAERLKVREPDRAR
jgi:hypothetical protein